MPDDDLYYHAPRGGRLPHIREDGLVPSAEWVGDGHDASPGKVSALLPGLASWRRAETRLLGIGRVRA